MVSSVSREPPADASRTSESVVIVGGGPVGLSTALGLAHHGVASVVVERDVGEQTASKAFGVWGRTLEVFADWSLAGAIMDDGQVAQRIAPVEVTSGRPIFSVDFTVLERESAMPGLILLPQTQTEQRLREAAVAHPLVRLVHGECVSVTTAAEFVTVDVRDSDGVHRWRADYVVGADGSPSTVRESQGLRHEGTIIDTRLVVFDVTVEDTDLPPILYDRSRQGLLAALRFAPTRWRVLASLPERSSIRTRATDGPPPRTADLPLEDLAPHARALFGNRQWDVTWQSQTTLYQQRVPTFRIGRILLAGDAAHLISPAGGQGMNQGIHDAENVAWSLAAIIHGADSELMLEGYNTERRRAADAVARRAHLNSVLEFRTPRWLRPAAFAGMRMLTHVKPALRLLVRRLSMRDLRYRGRDSPRLMGHHRAVGRRVPDVVLLDGTRPSQVWRGRAGLLSVGPAPAWLPDDLPVVAVHRGPRGWLLRRGTLLAVRPDRHVGAVLTRPTRESVEQALRTSVGLEFDRTGSAHAARR